jgi:hypothetical protein
MWRNQTVKTAPLLLTLFATFVTCAPAPFHPTGKTAVDLTRIDRKIAREPAYRTKPKYCLLVFGAEARQKVWLVLDGEVLYVDRNGNGDLTEKGKRFALRRDDRAGYPAFLDCDVGDIVSPDGKMRHTKLLVRYAAPDLFLVSVRAAFANPRAPHLNGTAYPLFADRAKDAPIVHFGGALTMRLSFATCDGERSDICARVGTPGVGKGSFVDYSVAVLQFTQAEPGVEVAYPGEKGGTMREKGKLTWIG